MEGGVGMAAGGSWVKPGRAEKMDEELARSLLGGLMDPGSAAREFWNGR
jgi:hypothetical protein